MFLCDALVTVVPIVPLVSLVSVGISLWCFGDCWSYSASGVLVYLLVFLCGALVTVVPLESLASIGASVS